MRRLLLIFPLSLIAYVVLALSARRADEMAFFRNLENRPLVIAHQGGEHLHPSNTMMAFQHAVDLGVDVLEMDIHSTSDGALVTIHDETVDRTTDGSGLVSALTLDEIKALDAGHYWTDDDGASYRFRDQGCDDCDAG